MEDRMSKFPEFDKKKTKERDIKLVVLKCLERMKHDNVRQCEDENIKEIIKILSELLSEKEAKDLLSIANYGKILEKNEEINFLELESKFFELNEKTSDYEKFLKSFYYYVLPAVLIADFHGFCDVRNDFLRYFILWDNFAEKRRITLSEWVPKYCFEASKKSNSEKLDKFNDIKALYKFAASEIGFLCYDQPATWCFYKVFRGLFNNLDFFKAVIEEKQLSPKDVLDIFAFRPELFEIKEIHSLPNEKNFKFEIFDYKTRLKLAEILFSWDAMTDFLAEGNPFELGGRDREDDNLMFFNFMLKLTPEYKMPIIRRVVESVVKKIKDYDDPAYFTSRMGEAVVIECSIYCGEDAVEPPEVKQFILETFLRNKIVGKEWFKNLPELFQHLVIVEQTRGIFKKAEIVVVSDLSETDIDKDKLKKDVDKFLGELAKIARNCGRPSDYYAGKFIEIQGVYDPEYYLTLLFDTAVFFLKDSFGAWKAVKPVLAIFRNLKEQAYSIDMKPYESDRYIWGFVPFRITPLLGSLESDEAAEVCEEWFKHLSEQLKSADDFAINKRKENPEDVPEEFKEGYDITVIEPHPLWREAFCEAAGDLRVNLGFNNCKIFNHLKNKDIDTDVREAAAKTLERIGKIKGKFDSGSRKRALLNAWWWYRVAHLKSLGIDFDWVSAQNLKIKEVKINYPKNC